MGAVVQALLQGALLWLAANAGSIAKRVLVALGIGIASYAALSELADAITGYVVGYYGELPSYVAEYLGLGGVPQAIGIVLSAFVARAAMAAASKMEYLAK